MALSGPGSDPCPPGLRRFEAVGHVGFFTGTHFEIQRMAVPQVAAAAVEIDDQAGVDQIPMLLEQKGRSVRVAARLFVRREREDEIPIGHVSFSLQSDERFGHGRVAILHVDGAAAVKPAVLLRQFERIDRPVVGLGLHDVEVAQKKHRMSRMPAAIAHHDTALGGVIGGRQEQHIGGQESRAQQPALDRLCRSGGAVRVRGVDLHQPFEHVARELPVDVRRQWRRRRGAQHVRTRQRRSGERRKVSFAHADSITERGASSA